MTHMVIRSGILSFNALTQPAKGDPVVILESMKMENELHSPRDGIVKRIFVEKAITVEKNQILVSIGDSPDEK